MTAPARHHHHRWTTRGLLGAASGLVLVVVLAGPAALAGTSVGQAAFGTTGCASAATTGVGLVIDYGVKLTDTTPPATTDQCVTLGSGTGLALLTAAGHTYRLNGSNLLCSIDGYPSSGCGEIVNGKYRYWSYWQGGSSWAYSSVGPAGRTVASGDVDGWHFVEGAGNPSDPPPAPAATGVCPTTTTTTPAPTTTLDPTQPNPGLPGVGGPAAGGGGGSRPEFHITPTIPAGTSGLPAGVEPGSTSDTIRGEGLTEAESSTSLGEGFDTSGTDRDGSSNEQASGEPGSDGGSSSSNKGVPVLMAGGGVVIVALGVTAALRFRAKPDA